MRLVGRLMIGVVKLAMVGVAEWRIRRRRRHPRQGLPRNTDLVAASTAVVLGMAAVLTTGHRIVFTVLLTAAFAASAVVVLAAAGEVRAARAARRGWVRGMYVEDEPMSPVADIRAIAAGQGPRRRPAVAGARR